jgi:hypothetical protein
VSHQIGLFRAVSLGNGWRYDNLLP